MADREHTTHYDDCGCQSARYEAALADLRARNAALEAVARAAVAWKHAFGPTGVLDLEAAVDALPEEMKRAYASDTPQALRKKLGG